MVESMRVIFLGWQAVSAILPIFQHVEIIANRFLSEKSLCSQYQKKSKIIHSFFRKAKQSIY